MLKVWPRIKLIDHIDAFHARLPWMYGFCVIQKVQHLMDNISPSIIVLSTSSTNQTQNIQTRSFFIVSLPLLLSLLPCFFGSIDSFTDLLFFGSIDPIYKLKIHNTHTVLSHHICSFSLYLLIPSCLVWSNPQQVSLSFFWLDQSHPQIKLTKYTQGLVLLDHSFSFSLLILCFSAQTIP